MEKALGRHILVEYYDCDEAVLNDFDTVQSQMIEAARRAGATIVGEVFHRFSPHGVSGAVVIAESHLSIHTWPEYRYAAVDLFTCGENVDPWVAFEHLRETLGSKRSVEKEIPRGLLPAAADGALPFKPAGAPL